MTDHIPRLARLSCLILSMLMLAACDQAVDRSPSTRWKPEHSAAGFSYQLPENYTIEHGPSQDYGGYIRARHDGLLEDEYHLTIAYYSSQSGNYHLHANQLENVVHDLIKHGATTTHFTVRGVTYDIIKQESNPYHAAVTAWRKTDGYLVYVFFPPQWEDADIRRLLDSLKYEEMQTQSSN